MAGLKLYDAKFLAKKYNRSIRRIQYIAETYSIGQLVGGAWIFTDQDIPLVERHIRLYGASQYQVESRY